MPIITNVLLTSVTSNDLTFPAIYRSGRTPMPTWSMARIVLSGIPMWNEINCSSPSSMIFADRFIWNTIRHVKMHLASPTIDTSCPMIYLPIPVIMKDFVRKKRWSMEQSFSNVYRMGCFHWVHASIVSLLLERHAHILCTRIGLVSGSSLGIPLPIIASNPHFLHADRAVQTAVEGLSPDEVLHRSFLDIEPITGGEYDALEWQRS